MLSDQEQITFTRLWTEAQPEVTRYVGSLVTDSAVVRDILQSTAVVLLRKFQTYEPSQPFLPWALGVAKYEILGHERDVARRRICFDSELLDRYTHFWAEVAPSLSDETHALQECIRGLPPRQRDLVRLRYFKDLRADEIAKQLELTATNVRVTLLRIREQLRLCVQRRLSQQGAGA